MKIIIHTDEYYPTPQACSYRMQTMAEEFVNEGNEVTVITSSTNVENGVVGDRKERILYSPAIRMKKKTTIMRMLNNLSFGISSIFTACKVGNADIVITTSPPPLISIAGFIIAKTKGAKLIYDVRDIWPDVALEMVSFSEDSLYCKIFRMITNFMYKHSDMVTTVSPGKVKKLQDHVSSVCQNDIKAIEKIKLVGNGFDTNVENFDIDDELIKRYDLKNVFTCVYIGNIGLAQGLGILLDIAEQTKHKEIQFLLFGKGAEEEKLKKQAMERGLDNVHFCGVLPHEKVNTLLSYSKLSFIPFKNSNMKDSIPTKIYEALGIGCPVFLVAEGDSCDIVNNSKLGKSVSPDFSIDFVKSFDEMIDNYSEYIKNRNNAKILMHNKYSRQQISIAFEKELHKLLIKKGGNE